MTVTIRSAALEATIAPLGAELQTLRDADGRDWLWDGDPAFWAGRAPILFPIVGTLAGGALRLGDDSFSLPRHGFARRSTFELVDRREDAATFRLVASDATRAVYPFDFVLDMRFAIDGAALTMTATLSNPGESPLPASFGYHPALRWPLPGGVREDHAILFAEAEPAPVRRLGADGLLTGTPHPTPIEGRRLVLDDALFADDALIFDRPASRSLTYGVKGGPQVQIDFPNMPHLALWTKPGAGYLCIEPWQGHSDPQGFSGDFKDKLGTIAVSPGKSHDFTMRIAIFPEG